MGGQNRGRLTVNLDGKWRLFTTTIPHGWDIIGTVHRDNFFSDGGALVRTPIGVYVQLNAGVARSLDQRKISEAILAASN